MDSLSNMVDNNVYVISVSSVENSKYEKWQNKLCMHVEHSSCNHLYNQRTRKELLHHLINFLFYLTCHADTWVTSLVYTDKCAPYSSSLSGLVAFSVIWSVTVGTLKGSNRFCLLLREKEGSVICFPLQWEKLRSCKTDVSLSYESQLLDWQFYCPLGR